MRRVPMIGPIVRLAGTAAVVALIGGTAAAQESAQGDRQVGITGSATAETVGKGSGARPYSPYVNRNYPTRPFFGDTHLHTSFSMDAGAFGARLGPREAYGFARGEQVVSSSGQPVKLSRPLDFLVVADHSDNMGFFPDLFAGKASVLADPTGRRWYDLIQDGNGNQAAMEIIIAFSHNKFPEDLMVFPRDAGLQERVAGHNRRRGGVQRSGHLHRFHRLRMDLKHRRQQPPPQRDLPRQRRPGGPRAALHRLSPARQRQPGQALGVDGDV